MYRIMRSTPWHNLRRAEPLCLEVFWMPGSRNMAELPAVSMTKGVFVWMSSSASNLSGHSGDFFVYFVSDATASWILGFTSAAYWHPLGLSSVVFPNSTTQSIGDFLLECSPNEKPYHAWAGYSLGNSTRDFQYHAVDWCWQAPDEYGTGKYHWFVLGDVSGPHQFHLSIFYCCKGTRSISDPPPPMYPAHNVHV